MSASWHYLKDGRPFGPFTLDQMRQLAASGLLAPTDMVKPDATGVWVSAGTVADLNFSPAPVSPPAVVPPPVPEATTPVTSTTSAENPKPAASAERSVLALAAVWLALVPIALALANRSRADAGNRLPTALLIAGAGLALATWLYLGTRAVRTGVLPTFSGRLRKRPRIHRVGGLALLFVGGTLVIELVNAAQVRPSVPLDGEAVPIGTGAQPGATPPAAPYERVGYDGGEEVLYRPGYRSQAEGVGRFLRECGYFDGASRKSVVLDRGSEGWSVKLVVAEEARNDPTTHALFRHRIGVLLAARELANQPVEIALCDRNLTPAVAIPVPPAGRCEVTAREAVVYLGDIRLDAQRLADYLRAQFVGTSDKVFVLSRPGDVWRLTPLHLTAEDLNPELEAGLKRVADDVSAGAFGGATVEIAFLDRANRPGRTLRSAVPPPPAQAYKGRSLQDWAAGLDDRDPSFRRSAAIALREFGPGAASTTPALVRRLADEDQYVRRLAAEALGAIGPAARDAVAALAERLSDAEVEVRKESITALGRIGEAARPSLPALAGVMDRPTDRATRQRLATAVGEIDPKDPRAVACLVAILGEDEWADRSPPIDALARAGKAAVPALIAGLKDRKRLYTRWMCVRALGRIGPDAADAVPHIMTEFRAGSDKRFGDFWQEGNVNFMSTAGTALGRIGEAATGAAVEASAAGNNPYLRRNAVRALAGMPKSPAVKARLLEIVRGDDDLCWGDAAEGLAAYGSDVKAAAPDLVRVYKAYRLKHGEAPAQIGQALAKIDPESARREGIK